MGGGGWGRRRKRRRRRRRRGGGEYPRESVGDARAAEENQRRRRMLVARMTVTEIDSEILLQANARKNLQESSRILKNLAEMASVTLKDIELLVYF